MSQKSVGINLSAGTLFGMEATYQQMITNNGYADFKVGYGRQGSLMNLRTSLNYDFVFPYEQNLNVYVGPGITTGYYYTQNVTEEEDKYNGGILNLTANLGAEYYFSIPVKLSFLLKPELILFGRGGEITGQLMLSYCFD